MTTLQLNHDLDENEVFFLLSDHQTTVYFKELNTIFFACLESFNNDELDNSITVEPFFFEPNLFG
jgi:hypothetical protein